MASNYAHLQGDVTEEIYCMDRLYTLPQRVLVLLTAEWFLDQFMVAPNTRGASRAMKLIKEVVERTIEQASIGSRTVDNHALADAADDRAYRPRDDGSLPPLAVARDAALYVSDAMAEDLANMPDNHDIEACRDAMEEWSGLITIDGEEKSAERYRNMAYRALGPDGLEFNSTWRTSTIVALARGIFEERAWDRMPILADALMDAGFTNQTVLHQLQTHKTFHRSHWVFWNVLDLTKFK